MDAHTQIDIEMKHEGDRLVGRARLIALSLALLLGVVIAITYALAATHRSSPESVGRRRRPRGPSRSVSAVPVLAQSR